MPCLGARVSGAGSADVPGSSGSVVTSCAGVRGGTTFGGGEAAACTSPISAVDTAIDGQRELEVPVRTGIATGEAELRDGDYFGTVLNRAARVMAAGHGGQILVADSTA